VATDKIDLVGCGTAFRGKAGNSINLATALAIQFLTALEEQVSTVKKAPLAEMMLLTKSNADYQFYNQKRMLQLS